MNKSECLDAIQQAEELIATLREILDGNDWDGPQAFMETVHDCQYQLNRALHAAIVPALNLAAPKPEEPESEIDVEALQRYIDQRCREAGIEIEEPAFLDDSHVGEPPEGHITTANARELFGWKPGETVGEAAQRCADQDRQG